jgi:hypothetical protein
MFRFEIKNRWNASLLFSLECGSIKLCLEAAVAGGANLRGADLRGADLRGANLDSANLWDANLRGADLGSANLHGADLGSANLGNATLWDANLRGADLRGANLDSANLWDADLRGADLRGADLRGANLDSADLRGADLGIANLTSIRDDIWAVLSASPGEVRGLRDIIAAGKINGSQYEGDCACLVGTLAKNRHCNYDAIPGLTPDSSRPSEVWFFNINEGDTPETSQFSKLALEWVDQWLVNMTAVFGSTT